MLRLVMIVLWPSFLAAIVAEGIFFSFFDPADITFMEGKYELLPIAVYSLGFIFFWSCCALASGLTCYLDQTPSGANRP